MSVFTLLTPEVSIADSAKVGEYLLTGAYPGDPNSELHTKKIHQLCEAGIRSWICLQTPEELNSYLPYLPIAKAWAEEKKLEITYLNLPIPDRKVVADDILEKYLEIIYTELQKAKKEKYLIYLHCLGGHGRTGHITTLLIAKDLGISTSEALKIWYSLHKVRVNNGANTPHKGKPTAPQLRLLKNWEHKFLTTNLNTITTTNLNTITTTNLNTITTTNLNTITLINDICIAQTKEGKQCSRKAKINGYCSQHAKISNKETKIEVTEVKIIQETKEQSDVINFYDIKEKPYGVFSNYYPINITIDGLQYGSSEHAFQEAKFTDLEYREIIRTINTPNKARELAHLEIKGGYAWRLELNALIQTAKDRGVKIREDWDNLRDEIMYKIVKAKFTQHQKLKSILLTTGNKLIQEASPRDSYWGTAKDKNGNPGLNKLGLILMRVREELRKI